jgi:hypothetical protein
VFLLFSGDLDVQFEGDVHAVVGQVELCLFRSPKLIAHFAGPGADLHRVGFTISRADHAVAVPDGANLTPPTGPALPEHVDGDRTDAPVPLSCLEAGDIASAEHFLFHVSGLEVLAPPVAVRDGGLQPQIDFSLPGWDLGTRPGGERRRRP